MDDTTLLEDTTKCDSIQIQEKQDTLLKYNTEISTQEQMIYCNLCINSFGMVAQQTSFTGVNDSCIKCEFKRAHYCVPNYHTSVDHDDSKILWYHCNLCEFKTKYKPSILKHFTLIPIVTTYQHGTCEYKNKDEGILERHLIKPQDSSEMTTYQCENCEYKTRYKQNLKRHCIIHQNPLEVPMYQCKKCKYKTKYKLNLKSHFVIHLDSSEVTMYQCPECEYKTKHKSALNSHNFRSHQNC